MRRSRAIVLMGLFLHPFGSCESGPSPARRANELVAPVVRPNTLTLSCAAHSMPTSRRRGSRRDERANERGRVGSSGKLGRDDTFLLPLALFSAEPFVACTTRVGG